MTHGVFLDTDTMMPEALDFARLKQSLDSWTFYPASTPSQVAERIAGADVVVTNKVVLDRDTLAAADTLKLVCVCATGTNNVDLDAARARAIPVCNVTGYAGPSVAQHTLTLMLSLATGWHRYYQDVKEGAWSRSPMFCLMSHPVIELAGKTLGIIGYGDLGQGVARLATAFGMEVLVAQSMRDPSASPADRVPLATLLARADVVSLHCPQTPETEQMVNKAFLAQMKPTAFLINTARGGLVDEQALLEALQNGQIAGAALDVLSQEPPPLDHPLITASLPNLIVTPHNAWISRECRQRLLDGVAENIESWAMGTLQRCVNGVSLQGAP